MLVAHILNAFLNAAGDFATVFTDLLTSAFNAVKDDLFEGENPVDNLKEWAKEFFEDHMPAPSTAEEVYERIKELYDNVTDLKSEVFAEIDDTVADILGFGEVPAQTDGQLGEARDIMTPDPEIGGETLHIDVGTIPGLGTAAVGTPRSDDGSGSEYVGGSGSGGGPSSGVPLTPLGGLMGTATDLSRQDKQDLPPLPTSASIRARSVSIQYQPTQGQVVITYTNGTTETRPWL